jgi:hypothetical protein
MGDKKHQEGSRPQRGEETYYKYRIELGMVMYTCNPSYQETEAERY